MLTSGAVFLVGIVPPSGIIAGGLGPRVELEEHVLQAGTRAQEDRRVLVDREELAVDPERDDRDAVLELDVLDLPDLDAGDVDRLALAGDDRLGGRELGLELERLRLEDRDPQPLLLDDDVASRRGRPRSAPRSR